MEPAATGRFVLGSQSVQVMWILSNSQEWTNDWKQEENEIKIFVCMTQTSVTEAEVLLWDHKMFYVEWSFLVLVLTLLWLSDICVHVWPTCAPHYFNSSHLMMMWEQNASSCGGSDSSRVSLKEETLPADLNVRSEGQTQLSGLHFP